MTKGGPDKGHLFSCPLRFDLFLKKEKMDFSEYNLKLNIKSCCLYEQITGRSFLKMGTEEDVLVLVYCCLVTNNPSLMMTYKVFQTLIMDKKVSKWITKEYEKISEFNSQIKTPEPEKKEENKNEEADTEVLMMTDIASALIVRHGVDAHYVMYEMELWEIQPYFNAADIQRKSDLITQRFWTYLTLAPNINTKKVKSPEDLVPFEWEEKKEEKIKKKLEQDTPAAVAFLLGNNRKKETDNGEQ